MYIIIFHVIYIVYCFYCSLVSVSSAFPPFSVFCFLSGSLAPLFLFRLLFLLLLCFLPSSFPFPIFLFPMYLSPLFVFFFPRFLLSPLLPAASSLLLASPCSAPPLLFPLSSLLPWSVFSSFSLSSSSPSSHLLLLAFLLVLLFPLLLLFSLLLSDPTIFSSSSSPLSSAPLPSSSALWPLSFFVFSSSIGRFFLPFSFPLVASYFRLVFLPPLVHFLLLFFFLILSVFPLLSFSLYIPYLPVRVYMCSCDLWFRFRFSSFHSLRLYSSAVSSLFRSAVAFCPFFPGIGNPAPGLPLLLFSPRLVVFYSAAPASFFRAGEGGGLRCLCPLSAFRSLCSLSLCLLYRFSLSFGRVRFFLRLSCLSLVVVLCSPDSFSPFGFNLLFFVHWTTLPLLCVSPLCCRYLRLSRSFLFFCLMFIPVSCNFSVLRFLSFRCGCCNLQQFQVSSFPSWLFCACSAFASFWRWRLFVPTEYLPAE